MLSINVDQCDPSIMLLALFSCFQKLAIGESGNLQIPLANGNVMKIPLSSVNITEEVNKTGIWKQVNTNINNTKDDKSPSREKLSIVDKL